MSDYRFEDITAAQALAFRGSDRVLVSSGTASETTVLYNLDNTVSVIVARRAIAFASSYITSPSRIIYEDGSQLYVGDEFANEMTLEPTTTGRAGAAYGGLGDDIVRGSGTWLVQGNAGSDDIQIAGNRQTIYGGQGDDRISFAFIGTSEGGGNFAQGNKGEDRLIGGAGSDTLLGGQGNDLIQGVGGTDFLNGNLGDDQISGGGVLLGEGGDDVLTSLFGVASTLRGGDGNDRLLIGGPTALDGERGANREVYGDDGDDSIAAGSGAETISGGAGADSIVSNAGNAPAGDRIDGGEGADVIFARDGANSLTGGSDADRINGGNAADTIDGGAGLDTLTGDTGGPDFGSDLFILRDAVDPAVGMDKITDWTAQDRIQLRVAGAPGYTEITAEDVPAATAAAQNLLAGGSVEVVAVQVGSDVLLYADGSTANTVHEAVLLVGRSLADISASNFV